MSFYSVPYKNAPITEAVIDIQVEFDAPPDKDQLLGFVDRFVDAYPTKQEMATFQVQLGQAEHMATHTHSGVRLTNNANDRVLQVRPNGFTYSHMPPYTEWDVFYSEMLPLWREYLTVLKPKAITRVAVRFINKITVPVGSDINKYVNIYPEMPEALGSEVSAYFLQMTFAHKDVDENCAVIVNTGIIPADNPEHMGILLDIDAFVQKYEDPFGPYLEEMLARLREKKNNIFESLVTDEVREVIK